MADSHKNFAYSLVATAPSPAASGTSLVVSAGEGTKFPTVPFNATVWPIGVQPTTTNAEIVRVTARATDTLTITRIQESTSARTIIVGDQISATVTAKTLTDVELALTPDTDATITFTDITTNDVSTTKHGFVPKAPNTSTKFLRDDASWATPWTEVTTTATGTQSGAWITLTGNTWIRANNATLLSIAGLPAGYGGQMVRIVSVGAGQVVALHQSGSEATAANKLINIATSGSTPGAAGSGIFDYQYDATTARWRLIAHDQGAWITPTFAGGDYTGDGTITWTVESGDVNTAAYMLRGRTLTVTVYIATTSTGGTASTQLKRLIPGGFTATKTIGGMCRVQDNGGTRVAGMIFVLAAGTTITYSKVDFSNFSNAAANNTEVFGTVTFEVD